MIEIKGYQKRQAYILVIFVFFIIPMNLFFLTIYTALIHAPWRDSIPFVPVSLFAIVLSVILLRNEMNTVIRVETEGDKYLLTKMNTIQTLIRPDQVLRIQYSSSCYVILLDNGKKLRLEIRDSYSFSFSAQRSENNPWKSLLTPENFPNAIFSKLRFMQY